MSCRARASLVAAALVLIPCATGAQTIPDPPLQPTVTADTASWFLAGDPVEWNGDLYYPRGETQFFNQFRMVRSGSFNGISFYIDRERQPNSVIFVPLTAGRVQPYYRATPETAAAPAPSSAPSLQIATDARATSQPAAVGTSGRSPTVAAPSSVMTTLQRPTGLNNIWVTFEGRRWFVAGKAIHYDAATLTRIGTYHGWSVYTRNGDASTIYIPAVPGRLTPYRTRGFVNRQSEREDTNLQSAI
jgi:hypothetical protein